MADPRLFRLRVTYGKLGRLALLSHLEIARALERTVRRAKLPFAVTNGFSPHMRIAFGGALPVGIGGCAEIFDIFLTDYVAPAKALDALVAASPADLMPTHAEYIEPSAAAASVAFPVSTYKARLSREVSELEVPETIEVTRKKNQKTIVVPDYLIGDIRVSGDEAVFTLESKPTGSLRPDTFLDACLSGSLEDVHVVSLERIGME